MAKCTGKQKSVKIIRDLNNTKNQLKKSLYNPLFQSEHEIQPILSFFLILNTAAIIIQEVVSEVESASVTHEVAAFHVRVQPPVSLFVFRFSFLVLSFRLYTWKIPTPYLLSF